VDICYTDTTIELTFEATEEASYLVNDTFANNDPLWMWTVMEAFIAIGDHDPTEYLEFEVAPNNKIWTGFIHNPTKDFSSKATAFIDDWETYPITSTTTTDTMSKTWKSEVSLPLSMFNVPSPQFTVWRMNFFRTYFAVDGTSEQEYGAWNPNKLISFHQTPCFGNVVFDTKGTTGNGSEASASDVADEKTNPNNYFCGSSRQNAEQKCIPCPSGLMSDCSDPTHACMKDVTVCSTTSTATSGFADELAPSLSVTVQMNKNFDHTSNIDCSPGDWGLCYTKTLLIDYFGDNPYENK
jgi:hypothetical protein